MSIISKSALLVGAVLLSSNAMAADTVRAAQFARCSATFQFMTMILTDPKGMDAKQQANAEQYAKSSVRAKIKAAELSDSETAAAEFNKARNEYKDLMDADMKDAGQRILADNSECLKLDPNK